MKNKLAVLFLSIILTGCDAQFSASSKPSKPSGAVILDKSLPSLPSSGKKVFITGQNGIDCGDIIDDVTCTNNKRFILVSFKSGVTLWYCTDNTNILGYSVSAESNK